MLYIDQNVKYTLHTMAPNRLKEVRLSRELSQVEFAESVGTSRQTIHAIETEKYIPSVELALKIAKALKLKVEDIFKLAK